MTSKKAKENNSTLQYSKPPYHQGGFFVPIIQKNTNCFSSLKDRLGETPFSERAKSTLHLYGPSQKCGRAIRATSVASFYPSREPIEINNNSERNQILFKTKKDICLLQQISFLE